MSSESNAKSERIMPKGGRKGGKIFPQYSLKDALAWSDILVSKTHTSAQPIDVIRASVIQAKSGVANMRISALRQYGLLQGESAAISATDLAKKLKSSPAEERAEFLAEAACKPEIFKRLFETFHGVSIALTKIKQRATELGIHPDSAEKCAQLYAETVEYAGLAKREGDRLDHQNASAPNESGDSDEQLIEETVDEEATGASESVDEQVPLVQSSSRGGRATVQVTINLDSTLDTDKLQKQLELLRKFGAL